jgi:hypothetical protein
MMTVMGRAPRACSPRGVRAQAYLTLAPEYVQAAVPTATGGGSRGPHAPLLGQTRREAQLAAQGDMAAAGRGDDTRAWVCEQPQGPLAPPVLRPRKMS